MCDTCGCSGHSEKKIEDLAAFKARVEEVITEQLRPGLQMDGGDIQLIDVNDSGEVYVTLQGACSTCPHAAMTLKMGVERVLREEIPEVCQVVSVQE